MPLPIPSRKRRRSSSNVKGWMNVGVFMKLGLLLAAFGTTEPDGDDSLARVEAAARLVFPGVKIARAFTSRFIRGKLEQAGRPVAAPGDALRRLAAAGCSRILVWPLFVAAGKEFSGLKSELECACGVLDPGVSVLVGTPLLDARPDTRWIAAALAGILPGKPGPPTAVILVGHGHKRQPLAGGYGQLLQVLRQSGGRYYFGALEGTDSLEALLAVLAQDQVRNVLLLPLLVLIGRHVKEDLAGPGAGSWRSILNARGISCQVLERSIADSEDLLLGWLEPLRTAPDLTGKPAAGRHSRLTFLA